MAHIAALLSQYYDKDGPQGVREIQAEGWARALAEFPLWAVEKATQWWQSADNPDRRKRPLHGDIVARCREEMAPIEAMKTTLRLKPKPAHEPQRLPVSPEAARKILEKANFTPRTFK